MSVTTTTTLLLKNYYSRGVRSNLSIVIEFRRLNRDVIEWRDIIHNQGMKKVNVKKIER